MPSMKSFLTNMSVPMPLHRKIYLLFRNNAIKIWRRSSCCGHHGEPGCWQTVKWPPSSGDTGNDW